MPTPQLEPRTVMPLLDHGPDRTFRCRHPVHDTGTQPVRWPSECPAAMRELMELYPMPRDLRWYLEERLVLAGRYSDLAPYEARVQLLGWLEERFSGTDLPTQRVGRPPSGAGPEPGRRMGSGSASPRG